MLFRITALVDVLENQILLKMFHIWHGFYSRLLFLTDLLTVLGAFHHYTSAREDITSSDGLKGPLNSALSLVIH